MLNETLTRLPDGRRAAAADERLARLKARRKRWLAVHLWLGLVLGGFFAVFGVTGSVLVFYEELNNALDPVLFRVAEQPGGAAAFRPLAEILAAAEQQAPPGAHLSTVVYPPDDASTYRFFYDQPVADGVDHWQVFADPYRAVVTGKRWVRGPAHWLPCCVIPFVFQLHYALLADNAGVVAVGIMGVVLVFSLLTGLVVWWPLTGQWGRALSIKRRASRERLNHDLHQTAGFYSALVLLAVLVSGVYMNLPGQFVGLVRALSPETRDAFSEPPASSAAAGRPPIGLAKAAAIAVQRYPEGRLHRLGTPKSTSGAYAISFEQVPDLSRFWSQRTVWVDPYSGDILGVRDPASRRSAGDTFLDWQWPLHSGKAFGWPGRILVFLAGLACPLLGVTGVIRWLQKRRAKQRKAIAGAVAAR